MLHAASASATIFCSSNVKDVFVRDDGSVTFWMTDYFKFIQVCNLNTPWKGVSVNTCFSWFSSLSNAVTHAKVVSLPYDGVASCAALPSYGDAPAPLYVMYGPQP